jgi:threonine synthase
MRYISTRGKTPEATLSEAITTGLAPDGGLYVPATFPRLDLADFRGAASTHEVATRLLRPFFSGDPLEGELEGICSEAFDFPAPLRALANQTSVLELFHGPTAAFKDFGARFLAAVLSRTETPQRKPLTILVATSGDTGGAVGAGLAGHPGL